MNISEVHVEMELSNSLSKHGIKAEDYIVTLVVVHNIYTQINKITACINKIVLSYALFEALHIFPDLLFLVQMKMSNTTMHMTNQNKSMRKTSLAHHQTAIFIISPLVLQSFTTA